MIDEETSGSPRERVRKFVLQISKFDLFLTIGFFGQASKIGRGATSGVSRREM